MNVSFGLFFILWRLDDYHTVRVVAVMSDRIGDCQLIVCNEGSNISINLCNIELVKLKRPLKLFKFAVSSGILGEIKKSRGVIVQAIKESEFFFCSEES